MNETILIVDDEKEITDLVEIYLKNDGYQVCKCSNGKEALAGIETQKIDLAILDIMLPDIDGFSLCKKIRETYYFPIIMLTAKVEDIDKINGLTMGADDYMTKPFNPLELVTRVKTQLRRYQRYNTKEDKESKEFHIRGLDIWKDRHLCTLNGKDLELTPMEFDIVYLAHELKTPLTSVIGYLTLLREETEISPKLREKYTGISLRKAERLEDLINEFFDVTRFNLTSMELEFERIHLSRMIEQICSEFEPVLQEKNLIWKLDIEPDIAMIGDPDKLSRVFDNLIRNACNYSYPDTEIQCSLKKENDSVVCRIKNHGKTISKEKMGRIFEQFFRVDSSRSSTTGGAGIGIAIAKEIVERHGGSIRAESAEESITFTVVFPEKS